MGLGGAICKLWRHGVQDGWAPPAMPMGEWANGPKCYRVQLRDLTSPAEGVDALREAKRRMELINNEATGAVGGAGGGPI